MSLTNRPLDVVSKPDRPAREIDAEDRRFGITPQMIEAGKLALVAHDPEHFSMDEIISSIWKVMVLAKS